MSLVERALKKLQESRSTPPAAGAPPELAAQSSAAAARAVPHVPAGAAPEHRQAAIAPAAKYPPPTITVEIDMDALRELQLLPPVAVEKQIASQYQHIKRPLVMGALGKSATAIPNGHLIMLASALPGEGKTFTSINLALSMAREKDIEVLLVDADVAKPHISRLFGVQAERGLLDLLGDSTLHPESLILPTNVPGLRFLPAGRRRENATEMLASARMEQVVSQLGAYGGRRIVLFDSPPLLVSTESRAIVAVVGHVVMVVRAESTSRAAVMDAIDLLEEGKPVAMILNQSESSPSSGYYGYGSYEDAPAKAAD